MASINEFFLKDEIQKELQCAFCQNDLDVPKVLSCGVTICTSCEFKNFKSDDIKEPSCPACWDLHVMPSGGFAVNDLVQKILHKKPHRIYRGEIHKKAVEKINEIGLFQRKFEYELSNAEYVVSEHCDILRSNVETKGESTIAAIQAYQEQLVSKINDYERKCIGKCVKLDEYKAFYVHCDEKYKSWIEFINQSDLTDFEIEKVINDCIELKNQMHLFDTQFNQYIFNQKKLQFNENQSDISASVIGVLSDTEELNVDFENLLSKKPLFKIKYEGDENLMNVLGYTIFEIDDRRLCLVLLIVSSNFYTMKIKILSECGDVVSEMKELLNPDYCQFSATRFHSYIAIAAFFGAANNELRLYDNNLNIVNSIAINYFEPRVFATDKEIYIRSLATSYLYIYDDKLTLLESLLLNNPATYPFLVNQSAQMRIKFHKIYSFHDSEITIADMQTRTLLKKIEMGDKYNSNDCTLDATSNDTFLIFDYIQKYLKVFNFDLECLMEFKIEHINSISAFSLTESGRFTIFDSSEGHLYVF